MRILFIIIIGNVRFYHRYFLFFGIVSIGGGVISIWGRIRLCT
jgi:hypothetical protein